MFQKHDLGVPADAPHGPSAGVRGGALAGPSWVLAVVVTVAAVLLFAYVFVRVPDRAFADDSYFYFQVAWHLGRGLGSTFNGLMPTNGYHPLWMLVCAAIFRFVPQRPAAVHVIAAVISLLDVITLIGIGRLVQRYARGLWPLSFLLLIPFCFGSQLGTEGALSGALLTLLMLSALAFVYRPDARTASLYSLVTGLVVLSRLDNIFIASFVWLAVWLAHGRQARAAHRLQLMAAPVFLVLWVGYIGSNWILFHTIQPISGMLKSTSGRSDHKLGANLPHTALIAGAVIVACLPIVAIARRRDLFFRVVELPFALGVLCHALYIVFIMSSETRWTWYYTSWILLGSILLARASAVVMDGWQQDRLPALVSVVMVFCALLLLPLWYKTSLQKFLLGPETKPPANFNAEVYGRLGIHRAIAYDEPGVFAYYSDIQIVPIDGLMGDLSFQHELATQGINEFVQREHIDGFIGPVNPIDYKGYEELCQKIFLSSERFGCTPRPDGRYDIRNVEIFARIPPHSAGTLALPSADKVYQIPHSIAVWRLQP